MSAAEAVKSGGFAAELLVLTAAIIANKRAAKVPDVIPDACHAALAIEHGCEWVNLDRGFARFPELRWPSPLAERP